jgi:MSHA pilin protein MshC
MSDEQEVKNQAPKMYWFTRYCIISKRRGEAASCPSPITHHPSPPNGYTVIELVVVIVILGVLAAIVGPRFFDTRVFNERGYADEIASAMRYSQKIAAITTTGYAAMQQVASGNRCNAGSSTWTTTVIRPDGTALAGTPPSDANVSGAATLVFDNKGAVISGATNLIVGPYTLALDAASGFVVVQ